MSRRGYAGALLLALGAGTAVSACEGLTGVDGLVIDAGANSASGDDGAQEAVGAADDGGADGRVSSDAGDASGDDQTQAVADGPLDTGEAGVPTGWTLVEVGSGACGIDWSGASPQTVHDGLQAAAATCSCSCTAQFTCSVVVDVYGQTGGICNSSVQSHFTAAAGQCVVDSSQCIDIEAPVASGSCMAQAEPPSIPPATWSRTLTVCTPSAQPLPTTDPGFAMCIEQDGDLACPTGAFGHKNLEYTAVNDSRACGVCSTCGSVTGASCGGTWTSYSDTSCGTVFASFAVPFSGKTTDEGSGKYTSNPSGGSCSTTSSAPATGTAAPAGPVTLCCE